jgi:NIPSNAP protein
MVDQPILDIRTYKLVAGRRDEFDRIVREHALPMLQRDGIRVVVTGPSLHDDDHYVLIRSFHSLEERNERLEHFYGSDEWLEKYEAPVMALIDAYHTVVIPATGFDL